MGKSSESVQCAVLKAWALVHFRTLRRVRVGLELRLGLDTVRIRVRVRFMVSAMLG